MYENAFSRKDLMTVGESWAADEEIGKLYSDPKRGELSMIFQFEHMILDEEPGKGKWCMKPLDLQELKKFSVNGRMPLTETGGTVYSGITMIFQELYRGLGMMEITGWKVPKSWLRSCMV